MPVPEASRQFVVPPATNDPTTGPPLALRPIRPEDEPFLFRVYAGTRSEELAAVPWTDAQKEAFLQQQFRAQHEYYQENYGRASFQVIEVAGQPAGRLYVDRRPQEIRLVDISLLPQYRGSGHGARLIQWLLDEARAAGKVVTIHVEKQNRALHLYERLGFAVVADRGVYWFLEWSGGRTTTPHGETPRS